MYSIYMRSSHRVYDSRCAINKRYILDEKTRARNLTLGIFAVLSHLFLLV